MPLLDHFHPPLSTQRHWESFHTTWAATIADSLNEEWLPEGYFAEEQLHPAARVEIDVATFEAADRAALAGGVALAPSRAYAPPAATWTIPSVAIEGIEIQVFASEGGPTLVGAIELVSPGNKDRPEARRAFAMKCASYLQQGVGLVIVDVVTSRSANLHNEIVELLNQPATYQMPRPAQLYAVAYRPVRRNELDEIEIWPQTLTIGKALPQLPVWIGPTLVVPVDLDGSYEGACRRRRIQ
jgi:hypothetical protein